MREKLTNRNRQSGFTIIEVVLVLAIAGLIFLIVFLALPQLQKSRRDTQRKSDAGRMLSALETYAGNNNGAYPTHPDVDTGTFITSYLANAGVFNDPSTGTAYGVTGAANTPPTGTDQIQYAIGYTCSGTGGGLTAGVGRDVAVVVYQETGGSSCQDNK